MTRQENWPRIHCGTFDAETCWRDDSLAKLPTLPDPQIRNVVNAMDELLFVFCREQDVLLTRYAMDRAHREYLNEIGFQFTCNEEDIESAALLASDAAELNIFQRLLPVFPSLQVNRLVPEGAVLDPFAILDGMSALAAQQRWISHAPALPVVQHVNSKLYSTELKDKLGIANTSRVIRSQEELEHTGKELLGAGAFLIKDTFGVSGKGNLLITTESMLNRISSYIAKQQKLDKQTLFIVEPLLNKEMDFSCQFEIQPDGSFRFIAVQQVINSDFAYQGSVAAAPAFIHQLEREGYFGLMQDVARHLFESGYFGHVCVDSMRLKDGTTVPIVEINARKSMSLIKHQLDLFLASRSLNGYLTYISMVCPAPIMFGDVLYAMEQEELLYSNGAPRGIIPLSANTFTVNQQANGKYKARLYVSIVAHDLVEGEMLCSRLRQLLSSLGIIVSS